MKRIVMGVSFVVAVFLCVKAFETLSAIQMIKKQCVGITKQNDTYKAEIDKISGFKDAPRTYVQKDYRLLSDALRTFSRTHDVRGVCDIDGIKEEESINTGIKASFWAGIDQMGINMRFYDVQGVDQYISIFDFIGHMEDLYALQVQSINQKGNSLEVLIKLYGSKEA